MTNDTYWRARARAIIQGAAAKPTYQPIEDELLQLGREMADERAQEIAERCHFEVAKVDRMPEDAPTPSPTDTRAQPLYLQALTPAPGLFAVTSSGKVYIPCH